jgi:hypothetical protein
MKYRGVLCHMVHGGDETLHSDRSPHPFALRLFHLRRQGLRGDIETVRNGFKNPFPCCFFVLRRKNSTNEEKMIKVAPSIWL